MNDWLTSKEAALILRTTPQALAVAYCRRKKHLPPRYMFGRRVLFKREEVLACIRPIPA